MTNIEFMKPSEYVKNVLKVDLLDIQARFIDVMYETNFRGMTRKDILTKRLPMPVEKVKLNGLHTNMVIIDKSESEE